MTAAASLPVQFGSTLLGAPSSGRPSALLTSGGIPAEAAQL